MNLNDYSPKLKTVLIYSVVGVVLAAIGVVLFFFLKDYSEENEPKDNSAQNTVNTESTENQLDSDEGLIIRNQTYAIVDTNQTQCYGSESEISCGESFTGQDAEYEGDIPAYIDEGSYVYDINTGLDWTKGYYQGTYEEALEMESAIRIGGYSDWRVPTIKELYSLIDFSGNTGGGNHGILTVPNDAEPYLDISIFDFEYGQESRFIDAQYVSSTAYVGTTMNNAPTVFGVNFADGRIKGYPQTKEFYIRFVRGNEDYGINDFEDNDDNTISDLATGLMWMQEDSGGISNSYNALSWEESLSSCEDLSLATYDDWRLPNAKELQSIVDYSRSPQTTDSASIDPIFEVSVIKDEGGGDNYPFYWTSTTHVEGNGNKAVYVAFGEALGFMGPENVADSMKILMDVHGAGAQRSDPKTGDSSDYPYGHGPQGDVIRIENYVRCVRDI